METIQGGKIQRRGGAKDIQDARTHSRVKSWFTPSSARTLLSSRGPRPATIGTDLLLANNPRALVLSNLYSAWQDGQGDTPALDTSPRYSYLSFTSMTLLISLSSDDYTQSKYPQQHSPSADSKISTSSSMSKSSGSSFARFLGRRRNDPHTFKQNRKAARPLALACPITPEYEKTPRTSKPTIVADSSPEPSVTRQRSAASFTSDTVLRGPTLTRVHSMSPTLSPHSSRGASLTPQAPPTPGDRSFFPPQQEVGSNISKQRSFHHRENSSDTTKQRPSLRRGRSSKNSTNDLVLTPALQQGPSTPLSYQSPLPSPRLDFRARNIERSTIEEDEPFHYAERLGSPVLTPLEHISSYPGIGKPATAARKPTFLSNLWERRTSATPTAAPTIAIPSPIILPGELTGTPVTNTSNPRPNYFGKRRHRSEDTISSVSPRTPLARKTSRRSDESGHASPRVYMDVTEWLEGSKASVSQLYIASNGKQYPRMQLTSPGSPSFLPSEMKRINTPPLRYASSAGGQRVSRGFFLDHRKAQELRQSEEPLKDDQNKKKQKKAKPTPIEDRQDQRDFFRMRIDDVVRTPVEEIPGFAFDIPDHLPNSPLCPLHPKHHGGPKHICPMHGRGKNQQS